MGNCVKCKWFEVQETKNKEIREYGYCNANPEVVKVSITRACRLFEAITV